MKIWKILLPMTALMLFAGPADAQSDEDEQRAAEAGKVEYAERLREAEERLELAAREIAEITRERLPQMVEIERRIEISAKPRLGIMIDSSKDGDPVDGVEVKGVTPGSAADEAGLRAGDIITAVDGNALSAENSKQANERLLDFMMNVEEGDNLKVEFLRKGNIATVELAPRVAPLRAFSWSGSGSDMHIEHMPDAPNIIKEFRFERGFPFAGGPWSSMELVALNEGLGKYFGTDTGLLVVSAPEVDGLELEDGDVIQSIDGRVPTDVRHALKILSSYESGEKLELGIMRDKKKRELEIEVPADYRGSIVVPPIAVPARAPLLAPRRVAPLENAST